MKRLAAGILLISLVPTLAPPAALAQEPPATAPPGAASGGDQATDADPVVETWSSGRLVLPAITLDARKAYEAKIVRIDTSGPRPRGSLGLERKPLRGAALYRAMGRDDLAASYERWDTTRDVMRYGGSALAISTILLVGLAEKRYDPGRCQPLHGDEYIECNHGEVDERRNTLQLALGLGLLGLAAAIYGQYFLNPHPVSSRTAARLAREHNRRLRLEPMLDTAGLSLAGTF